MARRGVLILGNLGKALSGWESGQVTDVQDGWALNNQ